MSLLTIPRSITQTRLSDPCFRSGDSTTLFTVRESCLFPAKTSYPSGNPSSVTTQPDTHLRAVAPRVPGIAPLRDLTALRVAFEVGARDVIEQQVTLQLEKLTEPLFEMRFNCLLVRQKPVERGIEPIGRYLLGSHAEQILERSPAISLLFDVQFARRFAEPGDRQDRGYGAPRHILPALRKKLCQQPIEAEHSPRPPGQPDSPKSRSRSSRMSLRRTLVCSSPSATREHGGSNSVRSGWAAASSPCRCAPSFAHPSCSLAARSPR